MKPLSTVSKSFILKAILLLSFFLNSANEAFCIHSINTNHRIINEKEKECCIANNFDLLFFDESNDNLKLDSTKFDDIFSKMEKVESIKEDVLTDFKLPIGIDKKFGAGSSAQLAVVNAYFTADYIILDLIALVEWTGKDINGEPIKRKFRFGCWGAKYYYEYGFKGESSLVLLNDVEIPVSKDGSMIIIEGDFDKSKGTVSLENSTYLKFGCNGIESLEGHFVGEVILKTSESSPIIPVKKVKRDKTFDFENVEGGTVSAKFNTTCSLDNFYFSTSFGLFTIGQSDFVFDVNELTVDLSSTRSPDFINNKKSNEKEIWEGFYIKDFTVYLPASFSKDSTNKEVVRITAGAHDLYVDENGISGLVLATNLTTLENGHLGTWVVSVDKLEIGIDKSILTKLALEGEVRTPVMDDKSSIKYTCFIDPSVQKYVFGLDVINGKPLGLDAFFADISIGGGEFSFEKANTENRFKKDKISATFTSGEISLKGEVLSSLSLGFEEFKVTNSPSISIKTLSPNLTTKAGLLSNFPITLNKFSFKDSVMSLGLGLNLMKSQITGDVDAKITCKSEEVNNRQKWSYVGLNIGRVAVGASFDKFRLKGGVEFYKSPTDKGFKGDLQVALALQESDSIKITSSAIFGAKLITNTETNESVKSFRYWHVDMMANFKPVNLFADIRLSGIGGGAANHMKHDDKGDFQPDSLMGVFFRVNTELLMPGTSLNSPSMVGLEMQFNKSWGLMYFQLFGKVSLAPSVSAIPGATAMMDGYKKIASKSAAVQKKISDHIGDSSLTLETNDFTSRFPSDETIANSKAEVNVELLLQWDNTNSVFAGYASAYVNVLDIISGVGDKGKAGSVYMIFSKKEWFVHAGYKYYNSNLPVLNGTVANKFEPIGLQMKVGKITCAESKGYFLIGHHIPELPNPKTDLGINNFPSGAIKLMNGLKSSGNVLDGKGLAFGVSTSLGLDDCNVSIITLKAYAYLGWDVLLKQYPAPICPSWPANESFGINNWWAQGQAYAGLGANIGIRIKRGMFKGYYEMAKVDMSVLLRATFPNPSYFMGAVSGEYSALGGMVKGGFNVAVDFGQKCGNTTIEESKVEEPEIELVNSTYPAGENDEMSCEGVPSITFNYEFGKPINVESANSESRSYKLICTNVSGHSTSLTQEAPKLKQNWVSSKKMNIEFEDPTEIWDSNSQIELEVEVAFQEMKNGEWVTVKDTVDGLVKDAHEIINLNFKTTVRSSNLEKNNITAMYPAIDQEYFYTGGSRSGFIKINTKQDYLFKNASFVALEFEPNGGSIVTIDASYNPVSNKITYAIPELSLDKDYLVRLKTGNSSNDASTVLSFSFHTSKHSNVQEKLNSIASILSRPNSNLAFIPFSYEYSEPFGREEILGNQYMNGNKPLLTPSIDIDNTDYYLAKMINLIYKKLVNVNSCGEQPIIGINKPSSIVNLQPYSTDWDVMKNEMMYESTFPFVVVSLKKIQDDLGLLTENMNSICSHKFDLCPDLKYIVEEFDADECSYNLPNTTNEFRLPLKFVYSNPEAGIQNLVKKMTMSYINQ